MAVSQGPLKGALMGKGRQLSESKTQYIENVRSQERTESRSEWNAIKRGKKNLLLLDPEQVPKDTDEYSCLIWQDPNTKYSLVKFKMSYFIFFITLFFWVTENQDQRHLYSIISFFKTEACSWTTLVFQE